MASGSATAVKRIKICGTNCTVNLEHALSKESAGEELDWNTVGNIITEHLENEVSKASKVDFKYGSAASQKRQDNHKKETQWQYEHFKYDVMVFRKKLSSLTCWMGRGIVDVPLQEMAEFLKNIENNISWDNYLVEARKVKALSPVTSNPMDYLGYLRYEHSSCITSFNREVFCFARCQQKGSNFIKVGLSVEDPDYPCPQGVKRIELRLGSGWFLEPYLGSASKTLVTYVVNSDLKGLPAFFENQVLKRQTLAVHYIRKQLIRPQSTSSKDLSDDEEIGQTDDSNLDRKYSSNVEFEDEVPTSDFIDSC